MGAALIVPVTLAPVSLQAADQKYHDKGHNDDHEWNSHEDKAYRMWAKEKANQRSGGKAGWWRKPAAGREVRPKGSALKGNRGLTIGRKSGEAAIGGTRGWIAQQTEAWRKRRKPEVSSRSLSGEIEQPAQAGGETNRDNRQSWHQAQAKGRKSRGK